MFTSLGLLSHARCPDPSCHRPQCLFSHGEPSKPLAPKKTKRKVDPVADIADSPAAKRFSKPEPSPSPSIQQPGSPVTLKETAARGARTAAAIHPQSPVKPPERVPVSARGSQELRTDIQILISKAVPQVIPLVAGKPPTLGHMKNSVQPYADRQKGRKRTFSLYMRPLTFRHCAFHSIR